MGPLPVAAELEPAAPAWDAAGRLRPPLFVDVDGTLLVTDLLVESLVHCARRDPWALVLFVWWWLRNGRAHAKARLAERCSLDYTLLPANPAVLSLVRTWRADGGQVVLATASTGSAAAALARCHGPFDGVMCSDGSVNLKAGTKLDAIRGRSGTVFAYCGDSLADLPVLRAARERYVVDGGRRLAAALDRERLAYTIVQQPRPQWRDWLRLLRPHQWVKNLLLFVPLLAAHRLGDLDALAALAVGFLAFGLVASGTYVVNDVLDASNDRLHTRKRDRPVAAGLIPIPRALGLALGIATAGFAVMAAVSLPALALLALYAVVTLAYSFKLKEYVLIDALTLAGLYTIRLAAGGAIAGIALSTWLAAFCGALFLSLALVKRCAELSTLRSGPRTHAPGRDYGLVDLPLLSVMGVTSGYGAVLLLALYADSSTAHSIYGAPHRLWLICPFLLYWVSRLWIKTGRGEMHDDPLVYTLKDRGSLITVAGAALAFGWSLLGA